VGDASLFHRFAARLRNTRAKRSGEYDYSHEVYEAMSGCLACKCCATQCPVRVDVPDFRSRFLELYHSRYLRPAKDYAVASLEPSLPWISRLSGVYNWVLGNRSMQRFMRDTVGLVDMPRLTGVDLEDAAGQRGIGRVTPESLASLSADERKHAVIVVQDAFTSYFETQLVLDMLDLLKLLGFVPLLAPYRANGKPLHVHGFLSAFRRTAASNAARLKPLESQGVPIIGVDPSMTLTYRAEYVKALGTEAAPTVLLMQEWLVSREDHLRRLPRSRLTRRFKLLAHCTEKTTAAPSIRDWQRVFAALGHSLEVVNTGCCGMAGTYGHEARHVATSKRIYALSWSDLVNDPASGGSLLATGYSCRSQVKRIDGIVLQHPAQALLAVVQEGATVPETTDAATEAASIAPSRGILMNRGCC
jgi:Fe-S oxidoreductase